MKSANSEIIISVVGAGLAGTECALQLARSGFRVHLYEMRPDFNTAAHKTSYFSELVCSNSLGNDSEGTAPAQLKWEAMKYGCFTLQAAIKNKVPAGQALAVDREAFAMTLTKMVKDQPKIKVINKKIVNLDEVSRPCVIATGPLTDSELSHRLLEHFGKEFLFFYDAIAPIIDAESIDRSKVWLASRYDKGTPDYLNCPLSKEEYYSFIEDLLNAEKIKPKDFDKISYFESCMPIEALAERGKDTLRFGPLKPVGLIDPRMQRSPFAVVQLRTENNNYSSYNMVGFQTRMTYSEQKRVFRRIPGLENAEFIKLGSLHKNLYIHTPKVLNKDLSSIKDENLYFAGQISGVEGYFESAIIGLLVARLIKYKLQGKGILKAIPYPETAMGALMGSLFDPVREKHFQPTNINLGLFPPLGSPLGDGSSAEASDGEFPQKKIDKKMKKTLQIQRAQLRFLEWLEKEVTTEEVTTKEVTTKEVTTKEVTTKEMVTDDKN